jgi:hypothetical protein
LPTVPRIYSTVFLELVNVGIATAYVVPAGHTAILKDMTFWLPSFSPSYDEAAVLVELDIPGLNVWDIWGLNADPGLFHWVGTQPFAHYLQAKCWNHPSAFRAAGYLLTNP